MDIHFIAPTISTGFIVLSAIFMMFGINHIILATTGGIFGGIQVYTGKKNKLRQHRKFGMTAATIWFFTAVTGIMVYVILYIMYPGGETTGLWDAIFH